MTQATPARTPRTLGERIVELLQAEGVSLLFSQGDVTTRDILKHARLRGLRVVGPRHESAGIFAAMGYYAVTGRAQAAFGAMGPGVANLLPAAVAASRENIPVLIFGARRHRAVAGVPRRGPWLHAAMQPLFERICKYAATVHHPADVDDIVREAFRQAHAGTPGPAFIEYDAMMQLDRWDYPPPLPPGRYRAAPQPASAEAIAELVRRLRTARSPIALVGESVQHRRARPELLAVCKRLGCPVLTTFAGSGLLPWSHPQWLALQSDTAAEAIAASDLLLVIGSSLPEMTHYGRLGPFAVNESGRTVISIDADPAAIGVNRPVDLAVIGDVAIVLRQLDTALTPALPENPRLAAWRTALARERDEAIAAIPPSSGIHPSRLMLEARKAIPEGTTIVLDGGLTIFHQNAFFAKDDADFVYGANYSHLGCGLPQAIGAQLAQGTDRPVCLITGDGAFGFHTMEFETAVRHRLPIVVLINDDRALGAEMASHMQHIGEPVEVLFEPVRHDRMAIAIGGHGEYVDTLSDLGPAIARAFASGKPAVVQVITDQDATWRYPHPQADSRRLWINADVEDRYANR